MNYYEKLGVPRNASETAIRTAYRRLARQHHPDVAGGSAEKFRETQEAYETLSQGSRRKAYDSTLREMPHRVQVTVISTRPPSSRFAEPLVPPSRSPYRPSAFAELDQMFGQFFRLFDADWF